MKTKKIIFSIISLFVLFAGSLIFAQPAQVWVKNYDGPAGSHDRVLKTMTDGEGNVYVSGYSYQTETNRDIAVLKYNSSGTLLWSRRIDLAQDHQEQPYGMFVDNSGNVYVTGESNNSSVTAKYNSAGTLQWIKTYTLTGQSIHGSDVISANDGSVYVTGQRFVPGNPNEAFILTIKYSSAGTLLWSDSRNYDGFGFGVRVRAGNDGNIYVLGQTGYGSGNSYLRMAVIKYSSAGAMLAMMKINHIGLTGNALPRDMELDDANNLYITGLGLFNTGNMDIMTVKLNSSFTYQWTSIYNSGGTANDQGEDIYVNPATGVCYVLGSAGSIPGDVVTIKYLANGTQQWASVYDGIFYNNDSPAELAVDNVGNVYISGSSSNNQGAVRMFFVKYNLLGIKQWETYFNGLLLNYARSMTIDTQGNIYLSGSFREHPGDEDFVLVKFGSTVGLENTGNELPEKFELSQNYPNPFNPVTNISFSLPSTGSVKLLVFDAAGKQVSELVNRELSAGTYNYDFNASGLSSGIYFYRLEAEGFTNVKKMILVK